MSTRNREWLQEFLQLGARAEKDGIPTADVERQEDTVLRALDMLDERPGIVLADEVGMGKTYEALGIAAATQQQNRRSRIVVVTPGPDLNTKWFSEFSRFRELYDFGEDVVAVRSLAEFVQVVRKHAVVVAPVTMFQSGRGSGAQTYLLSLYFHWKQLHGHTANAIMARFRDGAHDRVGECQGSCRPKHVHQAADGRARSSTSRVAVFSGLRCTTGVQTQARISRLHRSGWRLRARS